MDWTWASALTGGVAGALAGVVASVIAATRIARATERGKAQESARQHILLTVRSYGSAVRSARPITGPWPPKDPLDKDATMRFAEEVFRNTPVLKVSEQRRIRARIWVLVEAGNAVAAEDIAHVPVEDRPFQWRADAVVRLRDRVPDGGQLGGGLIGRAHSSDAGRFAAAEAAEELRLLELDLAQGLVTRSSRKVRASLSKGAKALRRARTALADSA